MMNYRKDILTRLIDKYEKRGYFEKESSSLRAIHLDVKKIYPDYENRYNSEVYRDINNVIDRLCLEEILIAKKDDTGRYKKIKLNLDNIHKCYNEMKRKTIPEQCYDLRQVLMKYEGSDFGLLNRIIMDWIGLLNEYKKLTYDVKYDCKLAEELLYVIESILRLNKDTYMRNFSTALFGDSKKFQKELKSRVENILFDYSDKLVEKNEILQMYNLYENPTYILIKGNAVIRFKNTIIHLSDILGGIALSSSSLREIVSISIQDKRVITIENLTTYHDSDEEDSVHIYLAGYHNNSKQELLKKIYSENKNCEYFHKGDIDVYGFLILKNLSEKTGISFKPLMMDIDILKKSYYNGMYKELTSRDVKIIRDNIDSVLSSYSDVLNFMLDNNCKVEQEAIKAIDLFR